MDGENGTFRKRWRHGSRPEQGARQTRDLSILSRAFSKPCSVSRDLFRFALCPSGIDEDKGKHIKAISMRVSRICTDAFREIRDRRKIDDFGLNLPGQVLGGTLISQTKYLPGKCARFFRSYSRCAHALLQPVTHGSPSLRTRVEGQNDECGFVWTQKLLKTERKVCDFQIYPADTCGRGLSLRMIIKGSLDNGAPVSIGFCHVTLILIMLAGLPFQD